MRTTVVALIVLALAVVACSDRVPAPATPTPSTPADMYHRSSIYIIDTEKGTAEVFLDEAGFSAVAWLRE